MYQSPGTVECSRADHSRAVAGLPPYASDQIDSSPGASQALLSASFTQGDLRGRRLDTNEDVLSSKPILYNLGKEEALWNELSPQPVISPEESASRRRRVTLSVTPIKSTQELFAEGSGAVEFLSSFQTQGSGSSISSHTMAFEQPHSSVHLTTPETKPNKAFKKPCFSLSEGKQFRNKSVDETNHDEKASSVLSKSTCVKSFSQIQKALFGADKLGASYAIADAYSFSQR